MKKLISLVLALALVLSMASFTASADDVVKLTWAQGTGSGAPIDNAMVLEALNAISREKLGVEVDIQYYTGDQIQLSIESGEVKDMYFTCSWYNNYNVAVSKGLYANIWGKVQELTPDLWATLTEDIWELARSTDGGLYAIPVAKDIAPMNFIVYDKSFAESAGIEVPERLEHFADLTPYLDALQKSMKEGEYAFTIGGSPAGWDTSFDFIDRTPLIGTVFGDTKVIVEFDDPVIMERLHTLRDWYVAGYINPDAATLSEDANDSHHNHIKTVQAWPGYDYSASYGYPCAMTCYSGPFLSTDGVQGAMNAFSITLEDDPARFELAMKYQELVNTDKQYRDILRWGIEGTHFNYVPFEQEDGTVEYAALRTETGKSNYSPWAFSQGSYVLATVECSEEQAKGEADPPVLNQWELYYDAIDGAEVSAISGFTFDSSAFENQYAEITAIKQEYMNNLATGTIDPDIYVPEMLDKMYAAGLQEIIDEAQRQLDEYLASKAN